MSIIVSTGAGGGYDSLACGLARHVPKYIPGSPNIIVQNMPGGAMCWRRIMCTAWRRRMDP